MFIDTRHSYLYRSRICRDIFKPNDTTMNSDDRHGSHCVEHIHHGPESEFPSVEKKEDSNLPRTPEPAGATHDAPDGGRTAWLVILGNWCTSFCSFGWVNSMSHAMLITLVRGGRTLTVFRYRYVSGLLLNPVTP